MPVIVDIVVPFPREWFPPPPPIERRPFFVQLALAPWRAAAERKPWSDWPTDEARRPAIELAQFFMPQTALSPLVGSASERRRWEYWPEDEARRERGNPERFFIPQRALSPVTAAASERRRWEYWPLDEAVRERGDPRRPFTAQTQLAPWRAFTETRQQLDAEGFRRVSEDGWSTFRPFWTQPVSLVPFFVYYPPPPAWGYWPGDDARRPGPYIRPQQTALTPLTAAASERRPWDTWPADEARRVEPGFYRVFTPQTGLASWRVQPANQQQQGPVEFRRVSEDGWSTFRFFWQQPLQPGGWITGQPLPTPWAYWPKDEAVRVEPGFYRVFMPQVQLVPWRAAAERQPWTDWTVDQAIRERIEPMRFFMPQTTLAPWVASQAETRQQQGPVEFRRVSDNGWDTFILFYVPPPPPPLQTLFPRLWIVGPKGIKTKISPQSGQDDVTE